LVKRKKKRSAALTAVSRKVLVMVYPMLTRKERCRWEDRHLTDFKIKVMRRACERKVFAGPCPRTNDQSAAWTASRGLRKGHGRPATFPPTALLTKRWIHGGENIYRLVPRVQAES